MQHIFYKIDHLSIEERENILRDAKNLSTKWWVDILDCSISWARRSIDMDFNEILKKLDKKSHFVFIIRDSYGEDKYIETGFSTMKSPSYFLWINMALKNLEFFEKKYKISPVKWGAII